MSVEQTTQLIQLILNSVLMSVACALVLGGLTTRHSTLSSQFHALSRQGDDLDSHIPPSPPNDFLRNRTYNRAQLRRFQSRYQLSRYSVLASYYALLFSILSCFSLALRGLLQWNALITLAMVLFVLGVTILLLAIGLTITDLHLDDFPIGDTIKQTVKSRDADTLHSFRYNSQPNRSSQSRLSRTARQKMRAG